MGRPHYVGLEEARQILAQMGVELTPRQMKRAADKDGQGRRKLPFFIDPKRPGNSGRYFMVRNWLSEYGLSFDAAPS